MPPLAKPDERFSCGVLNVDKPAGAPSFGVVRALRRLTAARRGGHAGTFAPLAPGVLPILFESTARLADFAPLLQKTYVADIHFGFTTPTDDAEGDRTPGADPSGLDAGSVQAGLDKFRGRIVQEPPAYSAVKIDRERPSRLARRGERPPPKAREADVYKGQLLEFTPGTEACARVEISCGSGTYLRSIARDLGQAV